MLSSSCCTTSPGSEPTPPYVTVLPWLLLLDSSLGASLAFTLVHGIASGEVVCPLSVPVVCPTSEGFQSRGLLSRLPFYRIFSVPFTVDSSVPLSGVFGVFGSLGLSFDHNFGGYPSGLLSAFFPSRLLPTTIFNRSRMVSA